MISKILGVLLLSLFSLGAYSQSNTVEAFQKKTDESGYNLFLYQSVIRVLNKDDNEEFNLLIKDLEYIKVLITDSTEVSAKTEYTALAKSIQKEGFEEMLMIDNKKMKASIYLLEVNGNENQYVAFMYSSELGRTGAFEMKGDLDLKYLRAFESMDFNKLKEIAEIKG